MKLRPTITATVIEDSISPSGKRVITLACRYPRIVHAESLTHRSQNRNAGSSRAIPVKKMLAQIFGDPAMPAEWGSNQSGMQAGPELTGWRLWGVRKLWSIGAKFAACISWGMMKLGAHKQVANRVTEPYQYMNVLVTATEWEGFDELRCHADADPTMRDLAIEIMTAIEISTPMPLGYDEWHLPYVTREERRTLPLATQLKLSTARCARVSFAPFDGNPQVEKEIERHDKLVGSRPVHASPTEHQCRPMEGMEKQYGNLKGWRQYRYQVDAEATMRDRNEGRKVGTLRRLWTGEDHKTHNRRKLEVQAWMQERVIREFGTAELPTKTSFARGGAALRGGEPFVPAQPRSPEMVWPFPLEPEPRTHADYPLDSAKVEYYDVGEGRRVNVVVSADEKSSGHGGLTSRAASSAKPRTDSGYPYPLDPFQSQLLADRAIAAQETAQERSRPATQPDPSPSYDSGSSGDSGGSSND